MLVRLADAIVAVPVHAVAGVPVVEVHVGRAVGVGASAELWQVTGVTGFSAGRASRLELHTHTHTHTQTQTNTNKHTHTQTNIHQIRSLASS